MGSASFPRQIAGLITEDPDEVKETPPEPDANSSDPDATKPNNWSEEYELAFQELEDRSLGDTIYNGTMIVGAEHTPGEEPVMYMRGGDPGYPGHGASWEWEILDVEDVYTSDMEGNIEETEVPAELKKKIIDALHKQQDDGEMQDLLDGQASGKDEIASNTREDNRQDDEGPAGGYDSRERDFDTRMQDASASLGRERDEPNDEDRGLAFGGKPHRTYGEYEQDDPGLGY